MGTAMKEYYIMRLILGETLTFQPTDKCDAYAMRYVKDRGVFQRSLFNDGVWETYNVNNWEIEQDENK